MGRAFRVRFSRVRAGFGFGPKVDNISALIRALDVLFVLGLQKQSKYLRNIAKFYRPNLTFCFFFGYNLGYKLVFGFGPGSGLN